jgi:hypothetical protein
MGLSKPIADQYSVVQKPAKVLDYEVGSAQLLIRAAKK